MELCNVVAQYSNIDGQFAQSNLQLWINFKFAQVIFQVPFEFSQVQEKIKWFEKEKWTEMKIKPQHIHTIKF